MPMASESERGKKKNLTMFTSIGSQESLDELGRDCGHGWSPEPSIFCTHCSCNLCLECYQSHNRHFHNSSSRGAKMGLDHPKPSSKISVRKDTSSVNKSRERTRKVLNESTEVETDLEIEQLCSNTTLDGADARITEAGLVDMDTDNLYKQIEPCYPNQQQPHNDSADRVNTCDSEHTPSVRCNRTRAHYEADICCDPDPRPTRITGIILVDKQLIATDYCNKCVKVIDTLSYKLISELSFTAGPWDLTKVSMGQIAVTLTDEQKIMFLRLNEGKLLPVRDMTTSGYCDGIACRNNMLVVTFVNPPKLEVLDLQGNTLQSIGNDLGQLFREPRHVAISHDCKKLYVSDFLKNEVICMTVDGKVLHKYTCDDLQGPERVVVDNDDNVWVCGGGSNNIHLISAQCEHLNFIVTEKDDLKYPQSVCYCTETHRLYIGMDGPTCIKVYTLQDKRRKQGKVKKKEPRNESKI